MNTDKHAKTQTIVRGFNSDCPAELLFGGVGINQCQKQFLTATFHKVGWVCLNFKCGGPFNSLDS